MTIIQDRTRTAMEAIKHAADIGLSWINDEDQNMQLGAEHVATVVILEAMSRGTEWLRELG